MTVETKYYKVLLSSSDLPDDVLRSCACAVGVVLANYYKSNITPMAVPVWSDDGDDLKFFEVSHAVQDWSKARAMHGARALHGIEG